MSLGRKFSVVLSETNPPCLESRARENQEAASARFPVVRQGLRRSGFRAHRGVVEKREIRRRAGYLTRQSQNGLVIHTPANLPFPAPGIQLFSGPEWHLSADQGMDMKLGMQYLALTVAEIVDDRLGMGEMVVGNEWIWRCR